MESVQCQKLLDFSEIDSSVTILSAIRSSSEEPSYTLSLFHCLFHKYVPFKASTFKCYRSDIIQHQLYNNNQALNPHYLYGIASSSKRTRQFFKRAYAKHESCFSPWLRLSSYSITYAFALHSIYC